MKHNRIRRSQSSKVRQDVLVVDSDGRTLLSEKGCTTQRVAAIRAEYALAMVLVG